MSIAGGCYNAIGHAVSVQSDAVQIFTKNQRQWSAKPLVDQEIERFVQDRDQAGIKAVVAHDSYLINLASPKDDLWEKSIAAFVDELQRCDLLGIPWLVTHPGSHTGSGTEAGIARVAEALNRIYGEHPEIQTMTLLETTAGQGSNLGGTFEELAMILERVREPERYGVCLDTCHIFVAGYDIRTLDAYATSIGEFDRIIGLDQIKAFHFNDAKADLGSHLDRHAHIGRGMIGEDGFRAFVNDPRFHGLPALLETEKGENLEEDRIAIQLLRSLIAEQSALAV
jgi:deoxyribonuclease-4